MPSRPEAYASVRYFVLFHRLNDEMIGGIGWFEMMLFGVVALMLFGAKLPEVARNLGGTYRGLKRSVDDFKREFQAVESYDPKPLRIEKQDEAETSESTAPKFAPPPVDD